MDGTKEYIRELKDYMEYLKDIILDLYDTVEDDTYITESRFIEIEHCVDKITKERKEEKDKNYKEVFKATYNNS